MPWSITSPEKSENKGKMNQEKMDVTCIVGKTPMLRIEGIHAKLETYSPSGSVKDRMACHMLKKAEERGRLKAGSRILEVTSGNTGIAFAMLAAARGYRFTAVMPENMSAERRRMMTVFGGGWECRVGDRAASAMSLHARWLQQTALRRMRRLNWAQLPQPTGCAT